VTGVFVNRETTPLPWQELKKELSKLLPTKASDRDKNIKVKSFGCD